jgi:hypothetical protein
MEWYHYGVAVIFVILIVSPVWFFSQVEKVLFETPDPYLHVNFINPNQIIKQEDVVETLNRDEKVLDNLNRMIKTSKKKHVKQMWKIKKAEFERELRWRQHMEWSNHVS